MCSNYTPPKRAALSTHFGVEAPAADWKDEAFPGYHAPVIRLAEDGSGQLECVDACFGMLPHWADLKLARHTYNARSETAASKPSFRHAVAKRQLCIVPAESIFEPNYETGKAVRWRIRRDDGLPMGLAGLWEWRPNGGPDDRPLVSFTMLTINADAHPLMQRFHRPQDEKRMVVVLPQTRYLDWLRAGADRLGDFLLPYPADALHAEPAPRTAAPRSVKPTPLRQSAKPESGSLWDD